MRPIVHPPADHEMRILALWDRSVGLDRWRRDDALLGSVGSPPRALGARNVALLALRNLLFDRAWALRSCCPACGSGCEFEADSAVLAQEIGGLTRAKPVGTIEWAGRSFEARAPTVDDLKAVAHHHDLRGAARALLARCLSDGLDLATMDDEEIDRLGRQLENLDPGAVITFQLRCPACDHDWPATMDVGDALWTELRHAAEKSLMEVDALARAYGWTEEEVMRLSPMRRAAYLQFVEAS